jgi:uncharacterized membrane protein
MFLSILEFITIFLLMLVTGVFWGTWFTLTRSINNFSSEEFIHIGKTIISNVAVPMRIIMPSSILFVFLSIWFYSDKDSTGFYLILISLLLIITSLLITVLIEVPIDNRIKEWKPETIPSDWHSIRKRWEIFHTIRTFTSIGSFAAYLIAALFQ